MATPARPRNRFRPRLPRPIGYAFGRARAAARVLPKVARLAGFLLSVNVVLVGLWAHAAQARLSETLLDLGAGLMRYAGALQQEEPRTLMLNGMPVQLSVGSTEDGVDAVLDHFQALCVRRGGELAAQRRSAMARLPRTDRRSTVEDPQDDPGVLDGVLRVDGDERGVVACLDVGDERLELSDLTDRLRDFVATGDVSRVGDLRYVIAERGEVHTVFVTLWTEGELALGRMFPAEGDAPGVDPPNLPRSGGDRRILSAWEQGQTPALNQYASSAMDAAGLDAFYRMRLPEAGWVIHEAGDAEPAAPYVGFVAERAGQMLALSFVDDAPGQAVATISTLRRGVAHDLQ